MKRILVLAVAVLFAAGCATGSQKYGDVPLVNTDHCASGLKQTANISFSTATTTSIIAPVTGANIYICGFNVELVQNATTANTFALEYGTGATCGTGTTVIANWVGNITANNAAPVIINHPNSGDADLAIATLQAPVPSQRLCGVTTQAAVVGGYVTYVQE